MYEEAGSACDDGWGPNAELQRSGSLSVKYAHSLLWGVSLMTGFVPFDVEPVTMPQAFATHYSLLTTRYTLLTTHYSLLTAYYLLLTA